MAVSVLSRPLTFILDSTPYPVSDIGNSSGDAIVTRTSHGLIDGQYVYIKSNILDYCGFWYVDVISSDTFKLKESSSASSFVPFIASDPDAEYYINTRVSVESQSGWHCAQLPIVYKLKSNLWPVNSADTTRDITGVTDSNGYCNITAAGDIKATGSAAKLEYVKITGASDDSLNGIYQIISYSSDTSFVIDLAYSSATDTDLTNNASIQYYYNNYAIKVKVYGGIPNGHTFAAQRPIELLDTLDLKPDTDGTVRFSIAEIVRSQLSTRNNALLATLPNNIDFWTSFYITYAESYDDSDGSALTTYTSSYTDDSLSFTGYAVNAMLPFKNVFAGSLTEYLMNRNTAKFLTLFAAPVLFSGCDFEISGIVPANAIRLQFENNQFTDNLNDWDQYDQGSAAGWSQSAGQAVASSGSLSDTKYLLQQRQDSSLYWPPGNYTIEFTVTNNSSGGSAPLNEGISVAGANSTSGPATSLALYTSVARSATNTYSVSFTSTDYWKYLGFNIYKVGPSSGSHINVSVDSVVITAHPSTDIGAVSIKQQYYMDGVAGISQDINLPFSNEGVYRQKLSDVYNSAYDRVDVTMYGGSTQPISETLSIDINQECYNNSINLQWLNYLGGFDQWVFTAYKENIIDIKETGETKENIFPQWPKSYGEFAHTIKKQTYREASEQILVRSQNITEDQLEAIKYIKTSPVVQIVNSRQDRRTVIVDADSFTYKKDDDKLFSIQFKIDYTDNIPSQRV